jgi:hypothetical protein
MDGTRRNTRNGETYTVLGCLIKKKKRNSVLGNESCVLKKLNHRILYLRKLNFSEETDFLQDMQCLGMNHAKGLGFKATH